MRATAEEEKWHAWNIVVKERSRWTGQAFTDEIPWPQKAEDATTWTLNSSLSVRDTKVSVRTVILFTISIAVSNVLTTCTIRLTVFGIEFVWKSSSSLIPLESSVRKQSALKSRQYHWLLDRVDRNTYSSTIFFGQQLRQPILLAQASPGPLDIWS